MRTYLLEIIDYAILIGANFLAILFTLRSIFAPVRGILSMMKGKNPVGRPVKGHVGISGGGAFEGIPVHLLENEGFRGWLLQMKQADSSVKRPPGLMGQLHDLQQAGISLTPQVTPSVTQKKVEELSAP